LPAPPPKPRAHPPTPQQRDLAPLPKLLRSEQRREGRLATLEAREALEREQLRAAVAIGALGANTPSHVADAGTDGLGSGGSGPEAAGPLAGLIAADTRPMDVPEVLSTAERRHWERTDEIIMGVLRR
jgi:hypothetical protein